MFLSEINSRKGIAHKTIGAFSISLFVSFGFFLIGIRYLFSSFMNLSNTRSGIISIATYAGVDINNRINIFYYKIFIVSIFFLGVYKFIKWYISKFQEERIITILSFVSILGTTLLIPSFFGTDANLLFIFFLLLLIGIYLFFRMDKSFNLDSVVALLLVSLMLVFILRNAWSFLLVSGNLGFGIVIFGIFCLLVVPYWKLSKKNVVIFRITLLLIMFIPIVNLLGNELFSIVYFRTSFVINPAYLKVCFFLVSIGVCYSFRRRLEKVAEQIFFDKCFYPLFIISFSLVINYSFFQSQNKELFELANPANAMMRLFNFGEIPLFEAFSSHLLSEQYYGIIYHLLNGYDASLGFISYQFLDTILIYIGWYYFLTWITGKGWFAVVVILFFPYLNTLIPGYFIMPLLSARLLHLLFTNYSFRTILYLIGWSVFLIIWRMDVGVANTIAVGLMLIGFFIYKREWKIVKESFFSLLITLGVLFIFTVLIYSLSSFDISRNLSQILDYVKSSIAHGLPEIAPQKDRYYYLHYQLFPLVGISILLFLAINFKNFNQTWIQQRKKPHFAVVLIFFLLYYIFNIQRGLVRHSLMESNDSFSSFIIFILTLFIVSILIQKSKNSFFIGIATGLIIFTGYNDDVGSKNTIETAIEAIIQRGHDPMNLLVKKTRVEMDSAFCNRAFMEIRKIVDKKFHDTSTFIDFSNTPMLYYYLQRKVPSVFNQYIQNTVSPYLQKENIHHLASFDVPFVVFSNYPIQWWDGTDGVPNALRYYHTVNHIYNHYKPWGIVNAHYLWIRKDIEIGMDTLPVDSNFVFKQKTMNVGKLCYLLGNTKEEFIKNELKIDQNEITNISDSIFSIALPKNILKGKGNWLVLEIDNKGGGINELATVDIKNTTKNLGSFVFESKKEKGKSYYLFPVSSFYNWHVNSPDRIILVMPSDKYKLTSVNYSEEL